MGILRKLEPFWREIRKEKIGGLLLTVLLILAIEFIKNWANFEIPNPATILLIPIVYSVLAESPRVAVMNAAIAIGYTAFYFSGPEALFHYTAQNRLRFLFTTITTVTVTVLTGQIRRHYENVQDEKNQKELDRLNEERFSNFANAIPHLIWTTDAQGKVNFFNKKWCEYVGMPLEKCLSLPAAELIHPDDLPKLLGTWKEVQKKGKSYETEFRIRSASGEYRWFLTRAVPIHSRKKQIVSWFGTATDIHDLKTLEEARAKNENRLTESEERHRLMIELSPHSMEILDRDGNVVRINRAWEQLWGTTFNELKDYNALKDPQLEQLGVRDLLERAFKGEVVHVPAIQYTPTRGEFKGKPLWVTAYAYPLRDHQGKVKEVVLVNHNITDQKRAEEQLEQSLKRQAYLIEAGDVLASSLDYQVTLKQIADLSIVQLADWAAVDMLEPDGKVKRLAVAHQDPKKIAFVYEIMEKYPVDMDAPSGLPQVLKTGTAEFYPTISEELIDKTVQDPEQAKLVKLVGLSSVMVVPIKNKGKVIGAVTFAYAESGRHYTKEDLDLAQELARRAASAIENAELFHRFEKAARREHEQAVLLDTLLEKAPMGFALLDTELRYVRINQVLAEMNGFPAEQHIGKTMSELVPGPAAAEVEYMLKLVLASREPVVNMELKGITPAQPGVERHWLGTFYPVFTKDQQLFGIGVVVNETTEQKAAQKEIHFRAYYDMLTGLPNRKSLEENFMRVLHYSKANNTKFAVLFIDADRLKNVNDTLGHDMGDGLLKEVAFRLKSAVRQGDLVSRWAGDEFVVLLPEIYGAAEVIKVSEKILESMEPVARIGNHALHVSVSIGVAIFPHDGEDLQTLQKNADTALYRAKDAGKNRYELYDPTMNVKAMEQLELENDLRDALKRHQFVLFYQPIWDVKSKSITSIETLIRWKHPAKGLLKPTDFLNIAEEHGLIIPIGKWVVRNACRTVKKLSEQGINVRTAVNISARQFASEDLVHMVLSAVKEMNVAPPSLELEVTENLAMENIDRTQSILKELKEAGIGITIDDFGTGYSSLNYLKRFPVNTLKVDKSFIKNCITNEQDSSIVRAIVSLAKSLHLRVVAEGVVSENQLAFLASLGCDAIQGQYISRPLSYSELVEFMRNREASQQPAVMDQKI